MSGPPRTVAAFLRPHRFALVAASALLVASALLSLVPHLAVYALAVDVFARTVRVERVFLLAGAVCAGVALRFVLLGAGYVLSHRVAFSVMRELRLAMTRQLAVVPGSFFATHSSGDLKKAVVDDLESLHSVVAHNIPELATGLLVPLVAASALAAVDWRMGLAAVALLPVAFAIQAVTMAGYPGAFERWHAAEARANEGVLEFVRGVAVLKAFDRDASSLTQVRDGILGVRDLAADMTRRSMAGYATFFSLLSGNLLVVLPAGLALHFAEAISLGELVLFVALGAGMLSPVLSLLFLFGQSQQASTALKRVQQVLSAEGLSEPSRLVPVVARPEVRFDDVGFTYPGRSTPALDQVSFTLKPGTVTAVVGASGAGKSTLVRLLVRSHDPDHGTISVGGVDLKELTQAQRVACIGHVSQDTTLFDANVRDNLRLASPAATDAALIDAAKRAGAHDFIEALPRGYDTHLGDRGGQLSGGERQRLAIARALLKDAPVLALDEVTANVDPQSEQKIQQGIAELAEGRCVLLVAHRLRAVADAHAILLMDAGRIADMGTHGQLLERCALYRQLWQDQEQAERWALTGGAA